MVWHPLGAVGRYLHRSCGLQHPSVSLSIPQHPSSLHILLTLVNACMRLLWLRTPGSCQRKIYPVEEVMPSSFSWAQRGTCLCFSPQRCKPGPGRRCSSLGGRVPGDGAATRVRREERLLPERFSQLFHPCFVLFPCSRDEVLYLGGGGLGGNICRQECPAVLGLPQPWLSQAAASAWLWGEQRWEEGRRGETESFLWQRIHLSQLINLTFTLSFSCKPPERFSDLREQSMGQRPPLCAQPRGAGRELLEVKAGGRMWPDPGRGQLLGLPN